jgi:hypothetical protein
VLEVLAHAVREIPPGVERDELEENLALRPLGMSALDGAPRQPDDAGAQRSGARIAPPSPAARNSRTCTASAAAEVELGTGRAIAVAE